MVTACFNAYPRILVEGLRKIKKSLCEGICLPGQHSNAVTPEKKTTEQVGSNTNASELYSGDDWFASRPEHRLHRLRLP
jgi:hypothetical protein